MIECQLKKQLRGAGGTIHLNIELAIEEGQLLAIHGTSGAGKTSILRMIAGLLEPDDGRIAASNDIWYDEVKGIRKSPQERGIGFVFQDYALFPHLSVRENLEFALRKGQDGQIIDDLLARMELGQLQHQRPAFLSGGQQQRVALARALVQKPRVLLLDEPLTALDTAIRSRLQDFLLDIKNEGRTTIILVSHDLGEIYRLADQVIVLDDGKVIRSGSPNELFQGTNEENTLQVAGQIVDFKTIGKQIQVTVLIDGEIHQVQFDDPTILKDLKIGETVLLTTNLQSAKIRLLR